MSRLMIGLAAALPADCATTQTSRAPAEPPSPDQIHELIDFWVARFAARLDRGASH